MRRVNRLGIDIGITLWVHGVRVAGYLCPESRVFAWEEEVVGRTLVGGNGVGTIPQVPLGPGAYQENRSWGDGPEEPTTATLRDMVVFDPPTGPVFHPAAIVPLSAVGVFCLGLPSDYAAALPAPGGAP